MTRLGLYHGPLYRGPRGYETYGPYARYVEAFALRMETVVLFAPVTTRDTDYRGCPIKAPNVRVVELPDFSTHLQATRHVRSLYRTFRSEIGSVDVVNCRNTAPYGYLLYYLGRARGADFFYHFTSDPAEILSVAPKYRGLRGWPARSAYRVDFAIQRRIMRRTYSFVNGEACCDRLRSITSRLEPVLSSTLLPSDFTKPSDPSLHRPVRLLYVGYLKHMKGLDDLIGALEILRRSGKNVELDLVGSGPEEARLRGRVKSRDLCEWVHFHGYVPMGPELNRFYDQADMFVFASLSEGSPRVVLEALAHSLPVVSTSVGSVRDLIVDGQSGLIVPLRDSGALAAAVTRLIEDDALRHRCARAGYAVAEKHTVEYFVAPMAEKAAELARRKDRHS